MQESVCMCVTKFLIKDAFLWRVLTVIRSHKNINSGSLGNRAVNNGDLFVCTAFIYSFESWFLHLSEADTIPTPKQRVTCDCWTRQTKVKLGCVIQIRVELR